MSKLNRNAIISNEQIQKFAPSVFTSSAMPGVSDRYQFVKTIDILDTMRATGFEVISATQSLSRAEDGRQYAKHAIKLVHSDYLDRSTAVGDVVPQIVLTNSHNRTSSFRLQAGLYRLICLNGMMTTTANFGSIRVLHNDPNINDNIIDGTNLIREVSEAVALPMVEQMTRINLDSSQQIDFARAASYLKFGEVRDDHAVALLESRRVADDGGSLWAVLNRVQENAVKGGYQARDRANRNVTVRGIKSVDRDIDFNVALWSLAAGVAKQLA